MSVVSPGSGAISSSNASKSNRPGCAGASASSSSAAAVTGSAARSASAATAAVSVVSSGEAAPSSASWPAQPGPAGIALRPWNAVATARARTSAASLSGWFAWPLTHSKR